MIVFCLVLQAILWSGAGFADDKSQTKPDGTSGLIAYLKYLAEENVIGSRDLQQFLENIKNKKRENPISETKAEMNIKAAVHRAEVQRYFDETRLNRKKLYVWTRSQIEKIAQVKSERKLIKKKAAAPFISIKLHPVPQGEFEMGEGDQKRRVTLTQKVKVMSTLVTQWMWSKRMGENPSDFKGEDDAITKMVNGKPIRMQPNHPVEQVTWWSAIYFANELSKEKNLEPVYDLSAITEWKGTPQGGDWRPINESDFSKLKINQADGNIYLAQGYRLPTEAEQEYIRSLLGDFNPEDHAWIAENSQGKSHAVAQKSALVIDGKAFYDLLGNVWEWGNDWYGDYPSQAVLDPQGMSLGTYKVFRGGSWDYDARYVRVAFRGNDPPGSRSYLVGFRLLRTIR